jgi:hypothetical protein
MEKKIEKLTRETTRIKPLAKAVEMTGGVEKFDEIMYGDHLLGKISGNFYSAGEA